LYSKWGSELFRYTSFQTLQASIIPEIILYSNTREHFSYRKKWSQHINNYLGLSSPLSSIALLRSRGSTLRSDSLRVAWFASSLRNCRHSHLAICRCHQFSAGVCCLALVEQTFVVVPVIIGHRAPHRIRQHETTHVGCQLPQQTPMCTSSK